MHSARETFLYGLIKEGFSNPWLTDADKINDSVSPLHTRAGGVRENTSAIQPQVLNFENSSLTNTDTGTTTTPRTRFRVAMGAAAVSTALTTGPGTLPGNIQGAQMASIMCKQVRVSAQERWGLLDYYSCHQLIINIK